MKLKVRRRHQKHAEPNLRNMCAAANFRTSIPRLFDYHNTETFLRHIVILFSTRTGKSASHSLGRHWPKVFFLAAFDGSNYK